MNKIILSCSGNNFLDHHLQGKHHSTLSFRQMRPCLFCVCLITIWSHQHTRRWHEFSSQGKHCTVLWYYPASIWGIYLPVQSVTDALWHKPLMQCSQWCKCHLYMLMIPFFIDTSCDKISIMALIIISANWKPIAMHVKQFIFPQTITV